MHKWFRFETNLGVDYFIVEVVPSYTEEGFIEAVRKLGAVRAEHLALSLEESSVRELHSGPKGHKGLPRRVVSGLRVPNEYLEVIQKALEGWEPEL